MNPAIEFINIIKYIETIFLRKIIVHLQNYNIL